MNIINEIKESVEQEYLTKIVENISIKLKYDFLFLTWGKKIKANLKNKTIVFMISDEKHLMPPNEFFNQNIRMVFKNYHPINKIHPKVRPLPLGFIKRFSGENRIKIRNRKIDYSFSGAWNFKRKYLSEAFEQRKKDGRKKYFFIIKNWCGKENVGLSIKDYSSLLSNSKISLCPPGYSSNESFRTCESAKCGNIIVSEDPYDFWYNRGLPFFKVENWKDLSIIDEIFSKEEDELQEISNKTFEWYQNNISPKAVASYIEKEIVNI